MIVDILGFKSDGKNSVHAVSEEEWQAAQPMVLRIFFKILVMRANFGDFGDFDIDFKILKKSRNACSPILGQIFQNFDHRILVESQSYDKPPWWNFDFWSNFVEIENFGF